MSHLRSTANTLRGCRGSPQVVGGGGARVLHYAAGSAPQTRRRDGLDFATSQGVASAEGDAVPYTDPMTRIAVLGQSSENVGGTAIARVYCNATRQVLCRRSCHLRVAECAGSFGWFIADKQPEQ